MDMKLFLILLISIISSSLAFTTYSDSLVIAKEHSRRRTARSAKENDDPEFASLPVLPDLYSMTIESNVTNRYARTLVTSRVRNGANIAQEVVFAVILPEKAFISKFVMAINGKAYEAYIKEKEQAKDIYREAIMSGLGAAHVAASARDSNRFTVSVNVEPASKASFYLTYEQLLERKDNKYELVVNIHPRQPVKDMFVNVHIKESLPLRFVHAPPIRSGNDMRDVSGDLDPRARIEIINKTSAHVTFKPSQQRQKELAELLHENADQGLSGQFIVEYDVKRSQNGGEILLEDGYFIHFFAPPDIEPLPKNVFFILDTSGSMFGRKMDQLKEAMNKILSELRPHDKFSIVEFNTNVKVFDINNNNYVQYPTKDIFFGHEVTNENVNDSFFPNSLAVTPANIDKAKATINKLEANGGTNIADALKVALHLVDLQRGNPNDPQPLIVFLTDGDATVGVTNTRQIIQAVTKQNLYKTPIYCLSFGSDADRKLLQKLSLKNNGFSRHIYEGADATLQLEEFYKYISAPIMNNVTFKYVSDATDITKTEFPILYDGSEIVVTGKIDKEFPKLPTVTANSIEGPIDFIPEVKKPKAKLERLWAYVTIQQLLDEKEVADNVTEIEKKALDIALKYSFVTPVSSLVVVKPNASSDVNVEAASTKKDVPVPPPVFSGLSSNRIVGGHQPQLLSGVPLAHGMSGPAAYPGPIAQNRWGAFAPPRTTTYIPIFTTELSSTITESATTTAPSTTTSTTTTWRPKKIIHSIQELQQNIPWLNQTLGNNVLLTEKGRYQIGINERSPDGIICPVTPKSGTGYCKHLHECPEVLRFLTNIHIFEQYRCDLNGFAAICCPPEMPKVQ